MSLWSRIERRIGAIADELLPDEFREQYLVAKKRIEEGEYDVAIRVLEGLLEKRPDYGNAWSLLGAARAGKGDFGAALGDFENAKRLQGDDVDLALARGQVQLALAQPGAALESYAFALGKAGGKRDYLAAAYRGLGLAHAGLGNTDKAVRELRKAVAENPDDVSALAALGESIVRAGHGSQREARLHLQRATGRSGCPAEAFLALARIAGEEQRHAEALTWYERALKQDDGQNLAALVGISRAQLALGNPDDARLAVDRALEIDANDLGAVEMSAQLAMAAGDFETAFRQGARAAELGAERGGDLGVETALGAALRLPLETRFVDFAQRHSTLPLARVILELSRAESQPHLAASTLAALNAANLSRSQSVILHCARAHVALGQQHYAAAARFALDALAVDSNSEEGIELLRRARDAERGLLREPKNLQEIGAGLLRVFRATPSLLDLAPQIVEALSELDQPLLVTVMGEFSSGKSTFINAFVGVDVAPMGITPTTSTINMVRYARERCGRIHYQDGRVEEIPWHELKARLPAIDDASAREIDFIELMLPMEELERIHMVDTPGLNSILPEHEQTARDFIRRADAVVWLFSAAQAGKASEKDALAEIAAQGIRVLGVVNKIDTVSPEQRSELLAYLRGELSDLVEAVVPVSARSQLTGGAAASADSNWSALTAELENRFFSQAREIKKQLCARRLEKARSAAFARLEKARVTCQQTMERAEQAAELASAAVREFSQTIVVREREQISEEITSMLGRAAEEVLELVRPRRTLFTGNKATRADRDYLLGVLEEGYGAILEGSSGRIRVELVRLGASVIEAAGMEEKSPLATALDSGLRWVESDVYRRTQAFIAGYLRGGYLDSFFRNDLPRLELNADNIGHALRRDAPNIDEELGDALRQSGEAMLSQLSRGLQAQLNRARVALLDLESGDLRALASLGAALSATG